MGYGGFIFMGGVYQRVILDNLKLRKFLPSTESGNDRCSWRCNTVMWLCACPMGCYAAYGLAYICVGFCVARFGRMGNAKASDCGTGNGKVPTHSVISTIA